MVKIDFSNPTITVDNNRKICVKILLVSYKLVSNFRDLLLGYLKSLTHFQPMFQLLRNQLASWFLRAKCVKNTFERVTFK